jgi:hypothetical protein
MFTVREAALDTDMIILAAIFATVSTAITVAVLLLLKKRLFAAAGGKFKGKGSGRGNIDGREYEYLYHPGSKNRPSSFTVSIACGSPGSFKVAKETGTDRFFKNIGMAKEIRTHDPSFDDEYYVTTDYPVQGESYFQNASRREAVLRLFRAGFNHIEHDGEKMIARCSPMTLKGEFDEPFYASVVAPLAELAEDMTAFESPDAIAAESRWRTKRAIVFAIPGILYALGVPALVVGIIKYMPLDMLRMALDSLYYSLPLCFLMLAASFVLLKGRSRSHREFMIVAIIVLSGIPLAGAGARMFFNGFLDGSQPLTYNVEAVHKYVSRSDDSTSYHLLLSSWRLEGDTEKLSVSSDEYDRVIPGRTRIEVTTRAGRYGYEWVSSYDILDIMKAGI